MKKFSFKSPEDCLKLLNSKKEKTKLKATLKLAKWIGLDKIKELTT